MDPNSFGLNGRFRVVRKLGEGGMAVVYLAVDTLLLRPVAIKVPRSNLLIGKSVIVKRFLQETVTQARAVHPGVVTLYEAGAETIDGVHTPYLVLEFVAGLTVEDCFQPQEDDGFGIIPPVTAARIILSVLRTFEALHANGIIHRDVKPSNIMLGWDAGVVKVMDFGTARAFQDALDDAPRETKTTVGMFSVGFSSPEQLNAAKDATEQSDIFSVAATLFAMVTGILPISLNSNQLADEEFLAVPEALRSIIFGATRLKPSARAYKTAREMADAIEAAIAGQPDDGGDFWAWFAKRRAASKVDAEIRCAFAGDETVVLSTDDAKTETLQAGFTRWFISEEEAVRVNAIAAAAPPVQIEAPVLVPPSRPFLSRNVAFATLGLGFVALALVFALKQQAPVADTPPKPEPVAVVVPAPPQEAKPAVPVVEAPPAAPSVATNAGKPAVPVRPPNVTKPVAPPVAPHVAVVDPPAAVPVAIPIIAPADTPHGTVHFDGGAQAIRFVNGGKEYAPGRLDPGTYQIKATFEGKGVVVAGTITVLDGQTQTVTCNAGFGICKAR